MAMKEIVETLTKPLLMSKPEMKLLTNSLALLKSDSDMLALLSSKNATSRFCLIGDPEKCHMVFVKEQH